MADQYIANSADLTTVADSIRAKTGRTELLAFPTGFASAVEGIPTIEPTWDGNGNLTSVVVRGYTTLWNGMFSENTELTSISLPEGITSIGSWTFANCISLALTSLPEGITRIDANAFEGCTSLQVITFQGTPRSIASGAFSECTNLATINVPWAKGAVANAPWGATNATINYNYTGS